MNRPTETKLNWVCVADVPVRYEEGTRDWYRGFLSHGSCYRQKAKYCSECGERRCVYCLKGSVCQVCVAMRKKEAEKAQQAAFAVSR